MRLLLILLLTITTVAHSQVVFNVPEIEVPVSEYINLPIEIETSGETVGSLEFENITVTAKAQEWLTYTQDWEGEKVRWGGYDASFGNFTISNTTELFTVRFKVIDQNWTEIPITIGRKTAGTDLGWDIDVDNTDGYVNRMSLPFDTQPADGIYGIVYPVTVKGPLTFELTVPDNDLYTIRVITYNGTLMKSTTRKFFSGYVSFQMDLSDLASAIYLLQVSNGRFIKTFKIIKK